MLASDIKIFQELLYILIHVSIPRGQLETIISIVLLTNVKYSNNIRISKVNL